MPCARAASLTWAASSSGGEQLKDRRRCLSCGHWHPLGKQSLFPGTEILLTWKFAMPGQHEGHRCLSAPARLFSFLPHQFQSSS